MFSNNTLGLLAISWFSSENGLQVYSHVEDKWIDVNYYYNAVVWMGEAASKFNSKIKTGIHRVLYTEKDRESLLGSV
jgi:hypothetical protein